MKKEENKNTIRISKVCYEATKGRNLDHFIDEMLGIVDYKTASSLETTIPFLSSESEEVELSPSTYQALPLR